MSFELFHFDSTPLTPLESIQKVIDISKKLSNYTMSRKIKLHVVSINELHQDILSNVSDSYIITILRRMMYRLADTFVKRNKFDCIVNGESLGQVASQTIESIKTISDVSNEIILRPLITYDKNEIIKISRTIETFDISIRDFNDCCSVYVPKAPVIKPNIRTSVFNEEKFNYQSKLEQIISNIKTITLSPNTNINLPDYGFDFTEAITNYEKDNK
jgi:thiamine biosynthesis protein ThiI